MRRAAPRRPFPLCAAVRQVSERKEVESGPVETAVLTVSMKTRELREIIYNIEFDVRTRGAALVRRSPCTAQAGQGKTPDMKQLSMMLIGTWHSAPGSTALDCGRVRRRAGLGGAGRHEQIRRGASSAQLPPAQVMQ